MKDKFVFDEVFVAYKKLKNYYYNDNTSLFIKKQIADFEEDIKFGDDFDKSFEERFTHVVSLLNSPVSELYDYLERVIDCKITPKSLVPQKKNLLSNRTNSDDIKVERINYFIDAPVIVHLISVLWVTKIGVYIDKLIDSDNYAYKLELLQDDDESTKVVNGFRMFKPYYLQYQSWRDNAIKAAERELKSKKDVVILSLDVKDYFHSVDLDYEKLKTDLKGVGMQIGRSSKAERLFELVAKINSIYTVRLRKWRSEPINSSILPIGIVSSGVLANYYLKDFDRRIKHSLNPVYYGRYVDDIMLVITNAKVSQKSISPANTFLNDYFVKRSLLSFDVAGAEENVFLDTTTNTKIKFNDVLVDQVDTESAKYLLLLHAASQIKFKIKGYDTLRIQSTKVMLQDFHHNESPALINKFKKTIEKNRSEFRFLPNEEQVDRDFDEEAFSMQYNDSINKLRSVKEFREDKYGASKYLAAKIFTANLSENGVKNERDNNQILTFFKGEIGIEYHTLWEKVATFFVINNEPEALYKFFCKTKLTINKIEIKETNPVLLNKLREDLKEYLRISLALPLAYNLKFSTYKLLSDGGNIPTMAIAFRKANLFRNTWISIPALNFTKFLSENDFQLNLLERDKNKLNSLFANGNLDLCERSVKLAPRYVQFHEVNLLEIYRTLSSIDLDTENIAAEIGRIPSHAFDSYWRINITWKRNKDEIEDERERSLIESFRKNYFEIEGDISAGVTTTLMVRPANMSGQIDKKIALANIKVDPADIERAFRNKANTSRKRRDQLFGLMNDVGKEKADIFVLPEVSVPGQWVSLLAHQAKKTNTCIVAGLEHWVNDAKIAFNLMAVILPISRGPYQTCVISLRLKNHYSPEENKLLKGNRLLVPRDIVKKSESCYTLFSWKGVYFSTYNCFELANINDRAIFKSKVDFIIVSEYNRDTYYFSEIGGSWVRDLHCYFIQVNSSDFGDSRIIQPSSSVTRNILQIKGGENSSILVGTIKIKKLRDFQLKDHYLQKDDGSFKPTPPDFDFENVEKRISNTLG